MKKLLIPVPCWHGSYALEWNLNRCLATVCRRVQYRLFSVGVFSSVPRGESQTAVSRWRSKKTDIHSGTIPAVVPKSFLLHACDQGRKLCSSRFEKDVGQAFRLCSFRLSIEKHFYGFIPINRLVIDDWGCSFFCSDSYQVERGKVGGKSYILGQLLRPSELQRNTNLVFL